jgi:polyisoprenyl-teichoic acid--peptidoglycan teichoic acid transferase
MPHPSAPAQSGRRTLPMLFWSLLVLGALFSGYFFFVTMRAIAARPTSPVMQPLLVEGEVSQDDQSSPDETPAVVAAATATAEQNQTPDVPKRKERVNILLLGVDKRPKEVGPSRTDTMILVSIDPTTNSAAMLSIPRDLWVRIPGYGEERINVAHFLGDARKLPGGGPGLAKKTVATLFGVPVHYYVRVNFAGFEKIIDAIGGITINVESRIYDPAYPDNNYGTLVVDIPAGVQQMDGKRALQYARSRHSTSDFDRMERQQNVIMAVKDKVMSLDIPVARIPQLLQALGDSVQTDIPLDRMLELADVARKLGSEHIKRGVIENALVTDYVTASGAAVELPNWPQIRKLVAELFPTEGTAATPVPATPTVGANSTRIVLQNGTLNKSLAQSASNTLRQKGYNVLRYDSADRFDYAQTVLIAYAVTGSATKQQAVSRLAQELAIETENIRYESQARSDYDVLVILGQDYVQRMTQ